MFEPIKLIKKDHCKCNSNSVLVSTLEGKVCTFCGEVYQKYDFDSVTFEQKTHYDIIPSNSEDFNSFSYSLEKVLFSIPPFEEVDISVQNSLISQTIQIIEKIILDQVLGRGVDRDVLSCIGLIITLGKLGVAPFEIFSVFKRDSKFEKTVTEYCRIIERKYKDLVYIDIENNKFVDRVFNLLEISFLSRKKILPVFKKAMKEVWFDGTQMKIVLAVCILHFTEGEEREWAFIHFTEKWELSENLLKIKEEVLVKNLPLQPGT